MQNIIIILHIFPFSAYLISTGQIEVYKVLIKSEKSSLRVLRHTRWLGVNEHEGLQSHDEGGCIFMFGHIESLDIERA